MYFREHNVFKYMFHTHFKNEQMLINSSVNHGLNLRLLKFFYKNVIKVINYIDNRFNLSVHSVLVSFKVSSINTVTNTTQFVSEAA